MTRVLVVDDEYAIVEALEALLTDEGYAVSSASNGAQALKTIREERPDVCIVDLMMPGISGVQLIEAMRADPDLGVRSTPVILMSAARKVDAARAAGAIAFLRKPFGLEELLGAIEAAVRSKTN